jgi:mono/diheme cytochrome c family protein
MSITERVAQITAAGFVVLAVAAARQPAPLSAHGADPTYAGDVAPILFKNCAACHHDGGMAPFSVLDYDSTVANVDEIRVAVAEGQMPPWHAEGPRGHFRNDRRLSDADKQTIVRWIDAGTPRGDMAKLPPKPTFTTDWPGGEPDLVVGMAEDFTVPASGTVEYQYFEVPTTLTEDRWVQSIQILPGAREVVHHVLVYARVPAPTNAATLASRPNARATPPTPAPPPLFIRDRSQAIPDGPPRTDSAHAPPRNLGTLIATEAPGTNVMSFPPGTALLLRKGTILTFQMHYTAHGHAMTDRTRIGFRFAKEPPAEQIFAAAFVNGNFTLPAGAKDVEVPATLGIGRPVRIWGMLPHTHLRGVRWQYTLEKPDGTSEIILNVPHYDFNWQTYYMFATPIDLEPGSKITSMAWYDNSASNKHNPDPTKDVHWGDQTWEEMQYTGFLYSIPKKE